MCGFKIQFQRPLGMAFTLDNMYKVLSKDINQVEKTILNLEEIGDNTVAIEFVESFNPTEEQKTAIKETIRQLLLPQVVEVPTQAEERRIIEERNKREAETTETKKNKKKQEQQKQPI